ncbi:hypothetical protein K7X08_018012 [Anisodus acutangulus]|uniref:Uncharacterized protein n=1 Tax=Anisodus acutangulus TaxID=402998 RepID=A0A9Q1R6V6_9SOLA|nr:hypothetical protein K7X08_018012 [Anisodus acutangulus]
MREGLNEEEENTLQIFKIGRFCYCRTIGFTVEINHLNLVISSSFTPLEKLKVNSDSQLLGVVADLKHGDEFDVFVIHGIDDLEFIPQPIGLLVGSEGDPTDEARATHVGRDINIDKNETKLFSKEAETGSNGSKTDLNEGQANLNGAETNINGDESDFASDEPDDDQFKILMIQMLMKN